MAYLESPDMERGADSTNPKTPKFSSINSKKSHRPTAIIVVG
jgi:hypothetical protein